VPPHDPGNPLGAFLRASRDRVTPEQVGLRSYDDQRRVSGLRREEVALLAGVSPSYYARLEQGHARHASGQVLDAVASALGLTAAERAHLHSLAEGGARRPARRRPVAERPDPALLELLAALDGVPAVVLGRRSDVLAWNPLGRVLIASHLDEAAPLEPETRPNMASLVFLDDETRALYTDWEAKARAVVGNLRLTVGRHPDDPGLAALVGRLSVASPEFAALWADQRVQPCATAVYALHHPVVGDLVVTQQTLRAVDAPDQTLVTHTAPAGSPSAEALALLAHVPELWAGAGRPGPVSTPSPSRP
jgi:transcriptional regulator with XRE-family HTH domain